MSAKRVRPNHYAGDSNMHEDEALPLVLPLRKAVNAKYWMSDCASTLLEDLTEAIMTRPSGLQMRHYCWKTVQLARYLAE